MKLKDALPQEFFTEFYDSPAAKYLDIRVVATFKKGGWIGKQKNVSIWWKLDNGYAVGWNENSSKGWSFPVLKINGKTK